MWTVADILPVVAPFVGKSGVDLTSADGKAEALKVYNDINEELLADDSWEGATATVEFSVCDGEIALPSRFETIRACTVNTMPVPIRPGGWRFLESGPGGLADRAGLAGLMDEGDHWATVRDLPKPMPIMIYSDKPESHEARAVIQGTDQHNQEIMRGGFPGLVTEPGERIGIPSAAFAPVDGMPAQPLITRAVFRTISMVAKPVTNGNVYILGYEPGHPPVWLATYGPTETRPSIRRYRILEPAQGAMSIVARVDLRFVPAVHDEERALIQFRPAYELYAKSLSARRSEDFAGYQQFRNSALAKLKRQREKKIETQTHQPNFKMQRSGATIRMARRRA